MFDEYTKHGDSWCILAQAREYSYVVSTPGGASVSVQPNIQKQVHRIRGKRNIPVDFVNYRMALRYPLLIQGLLDANGAGAVAAALVAVKAAYEIVAVDQKRHGETGRIKKETVLIILPCYNEAENIATLVRSIGEYCSLLDYRIIAVNDGSNDETESILLCLKRDFPMVLLKHRVNLGLSAALRTGFLEALKTAGNDDVVVVMDADMTHSPSYIPVMIRKMFEGNDVIVASRYMKGGKQTGVPLLRRILSVGASVLADIFFRLPVKDATSGYRCYKVSVLRGMAERYGQRLVDSKGFEVSLELLVKAFNIGARIAEIPITLDYSLKASKSKLKIWRTVRAYLRLIITLPKGLYWHDDAKNRC